MAIREHLKEEASKLAGEQTMIKVGDKVRILAGANKGKTGVVVGINGDRIKMQYGPSSYHRAVVATKHVERVERRVP